VDGDIRPIFTNVPLFVIALLDYESSIIAELVQVFPNPAKNELNVNISNLNLLPLACIASMVH